MTHSPVRNDRGLTKVGTVSIDVVTGGIGTFNVSTRVDVLVLVDPAGIAKELAKKALHSKSRKATRLSGAVVVRVLDARAAAGQAAEVKA